MLGCEQPMVRSATTKPGATSINRLTSDLKSALLVAQAASAEAAGLARRLAKAEAGMAKERSRGSRDLAIWIKRCSDAAKEARKLAPKSRGSRDPLR